MNYSELLHLARAGVIFVRWLLRTALIFGAYVCKVIWEIFDSMIETVGCERELQSWWQLAGEKVTNKFI